MGVKDEVMIATILKQIVEGLAYFHSKGLIHRDIKADNLLVHESGQLLLSNFSLTTSIKYSNKILTFVGSPCWMAPEKIEQKDGYDLKSDIWSLGITALELTSGDVPFSKLAPMKAMMSIFNSEPPSLSKYE